MPEQIETKVDTSTPQVGESTTMMGRVPIDEKQTVAGEPTIVWAQKAMNSLHFAIVGFSNIEYKVHRSQSGLNSWITYKYKGCEFAIASILKSNKVKVEVYNERRKFNIWHYSADGQLSSMMAYIAEAYGLREEEARLRDIPLDDIIKTDFNPETYSKVSPADTVSK